MTHHSGTSGLSKVGRSVVDGLENTLQAVFMCEIAVKMISDLPKPWLYFKVKFHVS